MLLFHLSKRLFTLHNTTRPHTAHFTFSHQWTELKDQKILRSFHGSYLPVLRVKPQESFQRRLQHGCDEIVKKKDLKVPICSELEKKKGGSTGIKVLCFYATLLVIKLSDLQMYIASYLRVWMLSVRKLIFQVIVSKTVCSFPLIWSLGINKKKHLTIEL